MALIDVSFLMKDPDFVSTFSIIRRATTVNNYGENVMTDTTVPAVGSIQAADGETLQRLPEGARSENYITIYTSTLMKTDEAGQYADAVTWKGRRYIAQKCTPWDNFGAGWYMVDCVMEKASL